MRFLVWLVAIIVVVSGVLLLVGPYEPADIGARYDASQMDADLDAHFARVEAKYGDITPGVEKRVVWAGAAGVKTPLSILYVHGFSATSEEIRPVPDMLAEALSANLIYTRLAGHGRSGDAMAEATVADWMRDVSEGILAAKRAGERVVILSTSTGGTLVTAAATDPDLMEDVAGLIFVSPNYGLNSPLAGLIAPHHLDPGRVKGQIANVFAARIWGGTHIERVVRGHAHNAVIPLLRGGGCGGGNGEKQRKSKAAHGR